MPLDDSDMVYIRRRNALVRRWPPVGWAMLAGIAAVLGLLLLRSPLLVNPWEVTSRLEVGTIATPTLTMMAALLPLVFLSCFVLLVALVLFQFAATANERRLLRIIVALEHDSSGDTDGI